MSYKMCGLVHIGPIYSLKTICLQWAKQIKRLVTEFVTLVCKKSGLVDQNLTELD